MEKWQRKYITEKLPTLIRMTILNADVLAILRAERILSEADLSSLEAIKTTKGRLDQTAHLYDLLLGRKFAYEKLTRALFENEQSGAAYVLLEGIANQGIRASLTYCGIHIEHDGFEETDILAYGRKFKLNTFFPNLDTRILQKIFYETLPEHIYYESFIKKKEFELFKDTIPPEPAFYVPRFISNRIKINEGLFQCNCPDVFVFKGMERYELSELAKPNYTASSRDQLECITSRFIYLDREDDWETIRDAATVPVHLITYESNTSFSDEHDDASKSFSDEHENSSKSSSGEDDDASELFSDEDDAALTYSLDDDDAALTYSLDEDDAALASCLDEDDAVSTFSSDEDDDASTSSSDQEEDTIGTDNDLKSNSYDSFILENTSGNSKLLSKYCANPDRTYIKEEEFVERQLAKKTTSTGVCICDMPGMGKTMLLANLARKFKQKCPTNIAAFITLADFVQNMSNPPPNLDGQPAEALLYVIQYITPTKEKAKIITSLVEKSHFRIYLFFDGFDEINSLEVKWMKKLFHLLKTSFHSIEMYVTSRPHMRQDLESSLKVVAYDILPFKLDNQVDFLVNSWTQEFPKSNPSSLKTYALGVLEMVKDTLSDDEKDIAGIPLLCGLIASVYAKEASLHSSSDQTSEFRYPARSICEMYKAFIVTKIDRMISDMSLTKEAVHQKRIIDAKDLKHFHVLQAWKLLFPEMDFIEKLEDFQNSNLDDLVIYKVGIMQQRSNGNTMKMEFVHRTFAEYLIAEYLAEYLLSSKISNPKYDNIFGLLLRLMAFDSYNVIRYFLNSSLTPQIPFRVTENQIEILCKSFSADSLHAVLYICCFHSYINIFSLLTNVLLSCHQNVQHVYNEYFTKEKCFDIVNSAVRYTNLHFVKECFQLASEVFNYDMMEICQMRSEDNYSQSLLQKAVSSAQYETVEFLIDKTDYKNQDLLRICVRSSYYETFCHRRLSVLQLLIKKDKHLIDECPDILMTTKIHIELFIALVKFGAPLESTNQEELDERKTNCVMFAAYYMSPSDFHKLLEFLISDCQAQHWLYSNARRNMTQPFVIRKKGLLPKSLDVLLNIPGVDINMLDKYGNNLAHNAVLGTNLPLLEMLIRRGTNYKCTGGYQRSCLHLAAKRGSNEIITFLVSLRLDPNQCDEKGLTPILLAVRFSDLETVTTLVKHGADCFISSSNGSNMLHMAARNGNLDLVSYCVNLGFNIDLKDNAEKTPIFMAAEHSNIEAVKLLASLGANFNTTNKVGENILHKAAKEDNFKLATYCIRLGMDPNRGTKLGITPMMWSIMRATQKIKMVRTLIYRGADINVTNNDGANMLHYAAHYGDEKIIRYCIELGLDPNQQTNKGFSPIMLAVLQKNWTVIPALIEAGADCNLVNIFGENILHIATHTQDLDIVEYCLNLGVNMNQPDYQGNTPLLLAASYNDLPTVSYLIEKGADYNLVNNFGQNILHLVAQTQDLNIIEYCLNVGLNINQPDHEGNTPLLLAASYNDRPTVRYLIAKGADYNQCSFGGYDISYYSISRENLQMLQYLQEVGWDPNQTNIYGESRIFTFAWDGWIAKFKLLVQIGADHKTTNYSGENLLHTAVRTNHVELLRYLLSEELPVNQQDDNGDTPILMASLFGDIQSVWTLMESGADYKLPNKKGRNIFHNATRTGNFKVTLFCMYIGMDPNQGDFYGNTPFLLAAQSCSSNLIQQMINCGADPKTLNNEGQNILHRAARHSNFQLIELCIELGQDPNQCDKNGDPPIFLAVEYADLNTVLSLMYHGADLYATNSKGQTILHIAAERGNVGLVNFCLCHDLDPNQEDNDEYTPLFLAAECGDIDTVHTLIMHGADYNSTNKYGQNIVEVAADWLNENLVSYCVNVLFVGQDKPEITPFQILQTGFRLPKDKKLRAVLKCQ